MPAPELLQVPGSSRTCFMHHVIRLLGVADPFARCQIIRRLSNTASFTRGGCSWLQPALRRAVQMVVLETESGANFGIDDWIRTLISECKIPQTSRGVSRKDDRSPPTASLVDPATQAFPRLGVVLHHCVTCSDAMQLSPARGLAMASPEPMLFWLVHPHGSSTSLSPSTTPESVAGFAHWLWRSIFPCSSTQLSQASPGASGRWSCDLQSSHRHCLGDIAPVNWRNQACAALSCATLPCNTLKYAFTWPSRGTLRFATFWKPLSAHGVGCALRLMKPASFKNSPLSRPETSECVIRPDVGHREAPAPTPLHVWR